MITPLTIAKLLCVILGAMFWSAASVLVFRFGSSRFRNLHSRFWNPVFSSQNSDHIGGFKVDAYHIFQGLALFFLFLAIVLPGNVRVVANPVVDVLIKGAIVSVLWIIVFPITYGFLSPYHKNKK